MTRIQILTRTLVLAGLATLLSPPQAGAASAPVLTPTGATNVPERRPSNRGLFVHDPAVFLDFDGTLWLSFGSFWSGIKLVQFNPATGKRLAPDSPLHSLAYHPSIEAPCLYRRDQYYYLFVNWGLCCRGTNSTYNIRVGRSLAITGPYLDKNGVPMHRDAGSLLLETTHPFIGPGQAGVLTQGGTNWLSFHYYDGHRRGAATLALRRLERDTTDWPVVFWTASQVP